MLKRVTLRKLMLVIPAAIMLTFADVFISFCVAATVFFQLFVAHIASKEVSLAAAIASAIAVGVYIRHNHKIQKFITSKDNDKNEQ